MKTRRSHRHQAVLFAAPVQRVLPHTDTKRSCKRRTAIATSTELNQNTADVEWNDRYEELIAYAEKNGNCLVPRRYPPNSELATWVSTQRRNYRLCQQQHPPTKRNSKATSGSNDTMSALTSQQIQKLEDLGFCWQDLPTAAIMALSSKSSKSGQSNLQLSTEESESEWASNFASLKAFVSVQGHANVPSRFPSHPKLCRWVVHQRQLYKQQQQQQQSHQPHIAGRNASPLSTMSKAHQTALESIGFHWNTQLVPTKFQAKNSEYDLDQMWNKRYQQLKSYYDKHGHCDVIPSENASLADWVGALRIEYQKHEKGESFCLTDAQKADLDKMSFATSSNSLHSSKREWYERYMELRRYKKEHRGSTAVPLHFKGGLGKWVSQQRILFQKRQNDGSSNTSASKTAHLANSLTDEQIDKLDDIDFLWQDDASIANNDVHDDITFNNRKMKTGPILARNKTFIINKESQENVQPAKVNSDQKKGQKMNRKRNFTSNVVSVKRIADQPRVQQSNSAKPTGKADIVRAGDRGEDDDKDDDDIMLSSLLKPRKKAKLISDDNDDDLPLICLKKKKSSKEPLIDGDNEDTDEEDDIMLSSFRQKRKAVDDDDDDMPLIYLKKDRKQRPKNCQHEVDDDDILLSSLRKKKLHASLPTARKASAPPTAHTKAMKPRQYAINQASVKTNETTPRVQVLPIPNASETKRGNTTPTNNNVKKPKRQRRSRTKLNDTKIPSPFPQVTFPTFWFHLPPFPFPQSLPWDMSSIYLPTSITNSELVTASNVVTPNFDWSEVVPFEPLVMMNSLPDVSLRPVSPIHNSNNENDLGDVVIGEIVEL